VLDLPGVLTTAAHTITTLLLTATTAQSLLARFALLTSTPIPVAWSSSHG